MQILFHTFKSHYPCVDVSLSSFAAERRRDEDTWSQSNAVGSLTDPVLATLLQPLYIAFHWAVVQRICTVAFCTYLIYSVELVYMYDTLFSLSVFSRDVMKFPMYQKMCIIKIYILFYSLPPLKVVAVGQGPRLNAALATNTIYALRVKITLRINYC